MKAQIECSDICTLSLTSALDDGRRSNLATAVLPPPSRPGKTASIHCTGGWTGPRDSLEGEVENSPQPGFEPRSILAHNNKILE